MNVTEAGDTFNCDCEFSWERGQSGSHICGDGLRKQIVELKAQRDALAAENASLKEFIQKDCCVYRSGMVVNAEAYLPVTPVTEAYINSVRAEAVKTFCQLIAQYGKVEPHHFNADFADLYAKINKQVYESILDNPAVYDMESLVDWLELTANDSRAYADMSIESAAQLRAGEPS